MSTDKHTPGPWKYRRDGDRHYVAYGIYEIVSSVWGTIEAETGDIKTYQANSQEREANARLIAASPEMLATLKSIAETLDKMAPCPEEILDQLLAEAQSAIKNAERAA